MDPEQLLYYVIRPVLQRIMLWSLAAEQLVLCTAAQESHFKYIKQLGNGPALGLWQMEPATHFDIWDNYLGYNDNLSDRVSGLLGSVYPDSLHESLTGNLFYAAAMCRAHYRRVPAALPIAGDLPAMAAYWKKYYNTPLGRGTEYEFIRTVEALVPLHLRASEIILTA